jgi:transcriptional regulator with XRE-family HTH domain
MDFGKLLRSLREAARVTMGDLAHYLKVSVTYISDVERGTRAPLSKERIEAAAVLFKLDREQTRQLLAAAAEQRGFYELKAEGLPQPGKEAGAALMRGWPSYTETDFKKLKEFLDSLEEKVQAERRG